MKSLLVDAMRQANKDGDGAALSDSGSFDTTSDQFAETANDAVAKTPGPLADDLQLLDHETPGGETLLVNTLDIDADSDSVQLPDTAQPQSASNRELSAEMATFDVAVPAISRAPGLSRYSPVICLALFLAAGFAWSAWQSWQEQMAGSMLGASHIAGAPAGRSQGTAETKPTAERFPFIAAAAPAAGAEGEQ